MNQCSRCGQPFTPGAESTQHICSACVAELCRPSQDTGKPRWSREFRFEALCRVCWHQFPLPSENAERVCPACAVRRAA